MDGTWGRLKKEREVANFKKDARRFGEVTYQQQQIGMEMEMNGNSATVDNMSSVVGDNDAGVDEAIRKITPVLADNAPPPIMASSSGMTVVDDDTSERMQHRHQTRRKNQQQQQQMQKNGTLSSVVALSGGSTTDNDNSYCTEIARRVVARGALHLGLDGMEGEALDVLGNVLLGYMEMVRPSVFYLFIVQNIVNTFLSCVVDWN